MTTPRQGYRALLVLYPRRFRAEFGEDLVQAFGDLARDLGPRRAWTRCLVDLVVIVPRLHLEIAMKHWPVPVVLALLVTAVVSTFWVGLAVALPVLVLAAVVALAQRTALAQALVVPLPRRSVRLRRAAGFFAVFAVAMASWIYHISTYDSLSELSVLLHNVIGTCALIAAVGYLATGLSTRRDAH